MNTNVGLTRLRSSVLLALLAAGAAPAWAQNAGSAAAAGEDRVVNAVRELEAEILQLRSDLQQVRDDAARDHADAVDLRRELEATRAQLQLMSAAPRQTQESQPAQAGDTSTSRPSRAQSVDELEQELRLLTGKVNEQYQTKLESASKYRVRFSGLVLANLFGNRGSVDNIEDPTLALAGSASSPGGGIGGTLRQTQLGFEAFGPVVAGARSRADLQMDFAGGFAQVPGGVTMGLVRLRTATAGLDWGKTSITAGQDRLFFAPLAPTSFASLEVPALAYAGNLWAWTPQLRVEHSFTAFRDSTITLQGGILDPVSGQAPTAEYTRAPQPGERSGQPALAGRAAWSRTVLGRVLSLGTGGYWSKQDYQYGRAVTSWLGSTDWNLPLRGWLEFSGSFYRGSALGGLGGGLGTSVVYNRPSLSNPGTYVQGLDTMGGWAQLKIRPAPKFEFNVALGQDNPFASQLRLFRWSDNYLNVALARNRAGLVNIIYRPRSDLLLSAEFRHLRSFPVQALPESANHINLGMGVLF